MKQTIFVDGDGRYVTASHANDINIKIVGMEAVSVTPEVLQQAQELVSQQSGEARFDVDTHTVRVEKKVPKEEPKKPPKE